MATPLRRSLSHFFGWLADLRVPRILRRPVYGVYCKITGADASEAQLAIDGYSSLGAFFVRRLKPGAREFEHDPERLPSPCDGTIQEVGTVAEGQLLQAKGRHYGLGELLAGSEGELDLEGAQAITIYLSPRDYHRVHAPLAGTLTDVRWVDGARYSVAPKVLASRERVFVSNERAVLRMESDAGPWFLVMVGALNVGRIRVVGVEPGGAPTTGEAASFARGDELARFEMGSTVVLVFPRGRASALDGIEPGRTVRLGEAIGSLAATSASLSG